MYPGELKYTKTHEWIKVEKGEGIIGITAHAVEQLIDVVFIEFPSLGSILKKDFPFGAIESVKAAFELYSPLSGEVVAVNDTLNASIDLVTRDPHGRGWMVRLKINQPDELNGLMTAEEYEKYLKG